MGKYFQGVETKSNVYESIYSDNSILQYLFYGTSIEILVENQQMQSWGFAYQAQNFNAGFAKPKLYNIFLYILFNVLN